MTDAQLAEHIRQMLPDIASPVRPGELVSVWIERAARACGVAPSRLRSYWHRKVEAPKASEYLAVVGAAEEAARKRRTIEELQNANAALVAELEALGRSVGADNSGLVGLLPPVAREAAAVARKAVKS